LHKISSSLLKFGEGFLSLIFATSGTTLFFNLTASDQYLAIVVPGRMYADTFRERGYAPENLSRTLEDAGTVTSVLIPWNTCGATQSSVLGVATFAYAPYAFFNLISPIMTIIFAAFKIKIKELNEKE
jgi:NhaC family Na+:H+ antiporter